MPRRREVREALDWEELEQAPNTRGAFSFLKAQGGVVRFWSAAKFAPDH